MQEVNSKQYPDNFDDEINVLEIFNILWKAKLFIVSLTAFISVVGVIYSLSLPNIYKSKALLVPVNSSSSISAALGGYGGLAGLAGISLGPGVDDSNSLKAQEKINSLSFFKNNVLPNIFLPDLMAVNSWDPDTNTLTYDESKYKTDSNTWVELPSAQQAYREFGSKLEVSQDKISGFVTVSIKHQSPYVAKKWVDLIIDEVNAFYRQKDKTESEKAVTYLNQQISITALSEIKLVLAQLLKEETKKLTLIEANESFVFDYIDPPDVMEKKSEPRRALICIISAILGGMLSVALVLVRHFIFNKEDLKSKL